MFIQRDRWIDRFVLVSCVYCVYNTLSRIGGQPMAYINVHKAHTNLVNYTHGQAFIGRLCYLKEDYSALLMLQITN